MPAALEAPRGADALRSAIFLLYGDPKVGKTTVFLRAFPRALYVGRRDAIKPVAESVCGFTPQPWQFIEGVTTLPQLAWWLSDGQTGLRSKAWQDAIRAHGIDAIYIDDLSQICTTSVIQWGQQNPRDKYYKYNQLDLHLDWIPSLLADAGLLCGVSAHKLEPRFDARDGSPTLGQLLSKGGPEVPSKQQIQAVPGWAGLVAHVKSGRSPDPWWQKLIYVDRVESGLWVSGDRNSVCWEETPANLREILSAASTPYRIQRLPGLEWQDDWAEHVSQGLASGEPILEVATRVVKHFGAAAAPGTPGETHVLWAIQDGIARHAIRAYRAQGILGRIRTQDVAPPPPPPTPGSEKPAP